MGKIYKDVYAFLMLKCVPKAENQDTRVERDISAALESVFPRSGLRVFVALSGPERRTQLEELAGILLGIRLYNRDTERSDEHYEGCLPKLKMPIDTKLMQRTHEITGLITAQSVSYVNFLAHAKQFNLSPEQDLKHKTDALFQQQTLAYLWTLQDDLTTAVERFQRLQVSYEDAKVTLGALIMGRTSVPKELVYPGFNNLATFYRDGLTELRNMEEKQEMLRLVLHEMGRYAPKLSDEDNKKLEAIMKETLPEPLEPGPEPLQSEEAVKLTLDESPGFLDLPLDCQGYCIATLVYRGILTPGNPMLGVVKAKGRHFVFQRDEYLEYFVANPDFFLQKMTEQCFASPHIIHMLQLEDFPLQSLAKLVQNTIVSQADECVETPLHFADSNVDKTYEWNCWTMRKTALQMANIQH